VRCLYPFYVETFYAAGAALRRNDEEWLACIREAGEALGAQGAWAVELAMDDASRGAPVRARAHLCPDFAGEECTGGRCPQPHGPRPSAR
jgi:hypothetical protein